MSPRTGTLVVWMERSCPQSLGAGGWGRQTGYCNHDLQLWAARNDCTGPPHLYYSTRSISVPPAQVHLVFFSNTNISTVLIKQRRHTSIIPFLPCFKAGTCAKRTPIKPWA